MQEKKESDSQEVGMKMTGEKQEIVTGGSEENKLLSRGIWMRVIGGRKERT